MSESLPVRGRGLKRVNEDTALTCAAVAPRAGAWIETDPLCDLGHDGDPSLPVRGRGLKPFNDRVNVVIDTSLPVRGRGLKHRQILLDAQKGGVAPRAGAWIETPCAT